MGGKKSSAPAPAPQVETPNVDIATLAAEKALAAQGNVRAASAAEEESNKRRPQMGLGDAAPHQQRRPERDRAQVVNAAAPPGSIAQSAVLTG